MFENRLRHLKEAHAAINKRIDGLEKTGKFDDVQLTDLKKQKLQLLDQIEDLKRRKENG